jgi:hypothetical protein
VTRASVSKGTVLSSVQLEQAVVWLQGPRVLGTHPQTHHDIELCNGVFGWCAAYGVAVVHRCVVHGASHRCIREKIDLTHQHSLRERGSHITPTHASLSALSHFTLSLSHAAVSELPRLVSLTTTDAAPLQSPLGLAPRDRTPPPLPARRRYVRSDGVNASVPKRIDFEALDVAAAVELLQAKAAMLAQKAAKLSTSKSKSKGGGKAKATVKGGPQKRAASAYLIFCRDNREALKAANPELQVGAGSPQGAYEKSAMRILRWHRNSLRSKPQGSHEFGEFPTAHWANQGPATGGDCVESLLSHRSHRRWRLNTWSETQRPVWFLTPGLCSSHLTALKYRFAGDGGDQQGAGGAVEGAA